MSACPASRAWEPPLLVVAGEASGDALAARVVEQLSVRAFGMGGQKLARAGAELAVHEPELSGMGPLYALRHLPRYRACLMLLEQMATQRATKVALLVGFSAFNARLGRRLRRRGVRVLWYAPPQVWAWRPKRVHTFAECCDRVALILPFEDKLWSAAGVAAEYVGHPSIELQHRTRSELRQRMGWTDRNRAVALLPGSRPQEVRRLLAPMLESIQELQRERGFEVAVLLAEALPDKETFWARELARRHGVSVLGGCRHLPAFDAALAASGTVTLECAMAGVPPVITYRTDALTAWVASRLLETAYVGLPNIILDAAVFPEALQRDCHAQALRHHLEQVMSRLLFYRRSCAVVREKLLATAGRAPSQRVACMLEAWLG